VSHQSRILLAAKSLSFTIGLLSLGAETLWIRTFSFQNSSIAKAVPFMLGIYLLGIALGAAIGARTCKRERDFASVLEVSLLCGAVAISLGPAILAASLKFGISTTVAKGLSASLAFVPACLFSICFPICHQIGTTIGVGITGRSMSQVYAANIAGSAIGPLFANFVLLQWGTTQLAFALLGLLAAAAATAVALITTPRAWLRAGRISCAIITVASVFAAAKPNNWLVSSLSSLRDPIRHVVETRQGTAVSYREDKDGDVIFGGNVYDGRTNLDPRINSNGINRVLVLAALRPKPERVLIIGLSIGSWSYLITGFPRVQRIDIVEINPGYIDLMRDYPAQQGALADPRVRLTIGDGRKFLRLASEGTYDLVVMNTTFNWRSYTSLQLSQEFLSLVRSRMAPGGLFAFNTTGSADALYTAVSVFAHAYLYDNFAICGDFDWRLNLDKPSAVDELLNVLPGERILMTSADRPMLREYLSRTHTATLAEVAATTGRPLELITDRNLLTEYKYGRPLVERLGY
jgi:predicted membrane-bound spermidine synthase